MDVRIDGKSIVQDGVADIPLCTTSKAPGLISIDLYSNAGGLYRANSVTGLIRIANAKNTAIDERKNSYCPIVPANLDYAVKAAMCDGKGAAWTADEQAAARERMGIGELELVVSATLEEESTINITLDKDGNIFDYDEVYINLIATKTSENISSNIIVGNSVFYVSGITNTSYNTNYFCIHAKIMNGMGFLEAVSHTNSDGNLGQVRRSFQKQNIGKIDKFVTYKPFPAGTQIIVYAR